MQSRGSKVGLWRFLSLVGVEAWISTRSRSASVVLLQLLEYKCIPTGIKENPRWRVRGLKGGREKGGYSLGAETGSPKL